MQVDFDKRFPIRASAAQAWAVLADIRATAACWPDASLGAQVDSRRYKGTVGFSIGAAVLRLNGQIELLGMDATRRELRLRFEGGDEQGSSATVELTARIEAGDSPGTSVQLSRASVFVSGPLAQQEARLLSSVGDRMFAQFADRFGAAAAAVPAPDAVSMRGAQALRGQSGPKSQQGPKGARGFAHTSAGSDSTLTLMVQAGQEPGAAFAAKGGVSLPQGPGASGGLWARLRRWLAGLFGAGGS